MSSGEERARLFVALELPDDVREALGRWRADVAASGLRFVPDEDLHVTLCFLGWRAASSVPAILDACGAAVGGWPGASLCVARAVWLPPRRPRVLAVALDDSSGGLTGVQAALSTALADGGWFVPEKRPFLAHVTVARTGSGVRLRPGSELDPPPPLRFAGQRITLFRSRLSPAGARYEALGTVALA